MRASWLERMGGGRLALASALAATLFPLGFVFVDPAVTEFARQLDPDVRHIFRVITDIGKSHWMLILSGGAGALMLYLSARQAHRRARVAQAHIASAMGFIFVSVAGSGIACQIIKQIVGRARPKFFETLGPTEFAPFSFSSDFASFPSGHSTSIFAFATALALLWPVSRVPAFAIAMLIASSRLLIGAHYLTDTIAGALLGIVFTLVLRQLMADRRWLFERHGDGQPTLRAAGLIGASGTRRRGRHRGVLHGRGPAT